ncbi:K02A2.6-like [Cordylochernes scorpioides]|uniref:K02A2.6-like n=1 Tax=Cordylochernes scorpioides TaxID=51811 RepID=A0ABY6KAM3_9ARAC|nr:K02A2.6-like [Cordylochernes scorpioides]
MLLRDPDDQVTKRQRLRSHEDQCTGSFPIPGRWRDGTHGRRMLSTCNHSQCQHAVVHSVQIPSTSSTGATPRRRPTAGGATVVQEIRATRADIADARVQQRSSTEDNCVFVEHCPDFGYTHYLQAVEELVGGAGNVLQVMKMDGHMLVGLSTKALAERLLRDGLEIGHTHLRAFPFKKRAERITVANLPFFVDDAAVIEALKPFGDVSSIAPIRLRAGRYTFTDGRREVFILLKEGFTLEKISTRVVIRNKGNVLSAFISYGVKCSRCGRQGHRRANCPINPGSASNNGQPQPAPLPPGASSNVSRQQSRPTPAAPALPMEETPSAPPPVTPAPPLQAPEGPVGPRPAGSQHPEPPPARPDLVAPLGPLPAQKTLGPAAPTPDVEMSIVEETFASSTSSAKNATRVDLDAFIEGHPSVSFAETDALGLGREEVLDLLSSRTKAQRKGPLLSPPQCDALAGLIRQILDLRPGAASNLYKVLGQVKAELRTTPTAVSPTPPLPAPRPAEPTPPAPHGKMTTPALATSPLFQMEEDLTSKRWDEAADIIYKLCNERYSGPLTDLGITEGDITDAVIYPEDREPLLRTCSTQKKTLITEIISAAIERARDSDPFVHERSLRIDSLSERNRTADVLIMNLRGRESNVCLTYQTLGSLSHRNGVKDPSLRRTHLDMDSPCDNVLSYLSPGHDADGNVTQSDNSYTLQHGAVDKSIELKQINSTLSRMEGIKPPAEFVPYSNEKKWETWRESFEIFAIAVNLESMPLVRQRAILKHIAGEKTVMIYKTFHISENDTYPNIKEMLDMLTNHFKPFKNTIQRRNAFFTCVQKEKQGIMEFVTELKHLAQECEFENLTESLIRDRLIIGILDREVKRKLLEDPQLTLPRAISIAVISESTCSQVASLNEQKMIEKIEKRNWVKDTIRMENAEAGPSGINPRRERIIEPCKWCGQRHKYGKCPAYGKKCNACGKTNHFSVVCRTKRIRNLLAESEAEESCDEINLNEVAVKTVRSDKWSATIIINGKKTTVHLDTGAQINVLPHKVINQWPSRPEIRPTSLKAFAYGNTELPIVGKCNVLCQYGEKKGMFEFIVADVEAQTLITGDTCEKLEILRRINHINTDEMKLCSETQKILEQYHEVFQGVGLINSECKIYTKPEYSPVQVPPRRIPTSLGAEVQSELEKMVKQGIVTKIYHETEWSHPMVVVKKKSGQIRICLDPRKLNEALVGRHFQTPAPAELLHEIPKAKYYTVLDVKSAYWHIPVAKECRDLLVMTTPFGKFRYNRLPFGLKISAQIFVEKMTNIFRDSFQNITYVDDLLIYADTIQEHNKKLKGILEKAKEKNIKFDLTKAQICLTKVRFLGHVISQNGIDPEPNKIDKLITFKRPEDKKSLQRIMGLYNYLGKFIPNLAASTSNIRGILRKNVVWHWGPKQDGEFDHIKECVRNAPSLAHFDKSKMLILQCDASKDAMGAALLQEDRPLAFASASFSDSQKQYSQIEKELLSVYYGCKKFEYLLSGHTFVVQTDHQPLLPLVKKPLSDISPRLQRLVMKLIAFDFKLQYKPGKYLIVADTLSRDTHPMDELPTPFLEDKRMVKMVRVNISDEKLVAMQKDTREDPALVKVIDYVIEGWPICKKDVDEDAKIFFDFRHRLYLWNDLLCIGSAIVIPKTQRNAMLNLLHQSHQGISAIQGLARESLFWPRMSIDIAEKKKPHLLVVDRYSGYPEVFTLDPPTAINVKNKLRETFARFWIPETMMSDNGPPFRSEIMTDFCIRWGIKQLFSSPHLHRSNGLAERNIQTIKNQLIKCRDEGSDPYLAILAYRNTPKNDLPSPAQLCLSRSLRCQIPRITPLYRPYQTNWRSIENAKRKRQSSMKEQYDRNSKSYPKVNVGEDAWCQIHPRETWTPVKISAQADSPQSFEVVTPSGNRLIRNQQFIRPRDGGYEKSQLSSEPITASPEAQHPQCYSPTMGESSTAPIQRSSEETNIDQREGATTSAGIAPEPSGRPRFSSQSLLLRVKQEEPNIYNLKQIRRCPHRGSSGPNQEGNIPLSADMPSRTKGSESRARSMAALMKPARRLLLRVDRRLIRGSLSSGYMMASVMSLSLIPTPQSRSWFNSCSMSSASVQRSSINWQDSGGGGVAMSGDVLSPWRAGDVVSAGRGAGGGGVGTAAGVVLSSALTCPSTL